jgi:hypothetical protein
MLVTEVSMVVAVVRVMDVARVVGVAVSVVGAVRIVGVVVRPVEGEGPCGWLEPGVDSVIPLEVVVVAVVVLAELQLLEGCLT